jgi:hypothetical protein
MRILYPVGRRSDGRVGVCLEFGLNITILHVAGCRPPDDLSQDIGNWLEALTCEYMVWMRKWYLQFFF